MRPRNDTKYFNPVIRYLFEPRFKFNRLQFNIVAIFFISIGIVFGFYATLSGVFKPSKALAESEYNIGSGGDTELTAGTAANVVITASNVTLDKSTSWFNLSWNYKKQLTLTNLSSATINANTPVQVSIDTSSLESVQADCDDLRIVYQNSTDLARSYTVASGSTNCSDSKSTIVTFPLQANITSGSSDSTNYFLYYGNTGTSAPSFPKEKALNFDGSNDYVNVPHSTSVAIKQDMTISMWVNPTSISGSVNARFAYKYDDANNAYIIGMANTTGKVFAKFVYNGVTYEKGGNTGNAGLAITTGVWTHIAVTFSNGTIAIYINGVDKSSGVGFAPAVNITTTSLAIGAQSSGGSSFAGYIDEFRIWDRVLTTGEVLSRMNTEIDSTDVYWSNLKGYWKFNEGTGQTVADSSTSGGNGTLGATSSSETTDPTWITSVNTAHSFSTKNATLICPFNTSNTCADGEAPSTASGAIRYSGGKSAMKFDGVNDSVSITSFSTSGYSQLTLEGWVNIQQYVTDSGPARIIDINNEHFLRIQSNGKIDFCIFTSASDCNTLSTTILSKNTWYHIAGTWDGTTKRLFINGVLEDSDAVSGTLTSGWATGVGGTRGGSAVRLWEGSLDELRVSNTARYTANFTPSTAPFLKDSNTKLLYHFDENGDDPRNTGKAIDASGNAVHGTLTNGPTYISGLVGVNSSSSNTGNIPTQPYASHQGVFLEEGTTNLVTNPSFETGTTSWGGVSTTRTQDSTASKFGSYSLKVVGDSADANARAFYQFSYSTSTTYTFSAWLRTDTATATGVKISLLETGGTNQQGSVFTVDTEWKRYSATFTTSGSLSAAYMAVYVQSTGSLDKTIFIDGVQVEQKSSATTYTDGTLGTGYTWSGTAHASTSTRTIGYLKYATSGNISTTRGTFSFWIKPDWNGNNGRAHDMTSVFIDNNNRLTFQKTSSNFLTMFYTVSGSSATQASVSISDWTRGNWYYVAGVWDSTAPVSSTNIYSSIFVNGTRTNASAGSTFTPLTSTGNDLYLGTSADSVAANALISDYRIYNQALSSSEVTDIYNSGLLTHQQGSSSQAKYASSGTWTSPTLDLSSNGQWGENPNVTVSEILNGNTISYEARSSIDGAIWSNYATINSNNILAADTTPQRYLQLRATLNSSSGATTPSLNTIAVRYVEDTTSPTVNASNIIMNKFNGGTQLNSNDWTNNLSPYFSWTAGADDTEGSGLRGYCLYLGQDSSGDPATTKGLLGTSPTSTANSTCQFITSSTSIDFANTALRGSTWITSSSDPYYLNIKAIDNTGNVFVGSSEQFQFRFDNTPPSNPTGLSAPQDFQRDISSFTILWPTTGANSAVDENSDVKGYQYKINDGTWQGELHDNSESCEDILTEGTYTLNEDYDSLNVGENVFYLRTLDNACNITSTHITAILKYSADAPSAPTNLEVTPSSNTQNSFAFSWEKPTTFTGSEAALTYCYTVNTTPTAETCIWTSDTSLDADAYATQPGKNTFYVIAKDEAGNTNFDDYSEIDFFANTSAPSVPLSMDIADVSIKATSRWRLAISWDTPADEGAGIRTYKVYRSINENVSCTDEFNKFSLVASTSGTSYVDSNLQQKKYYYCVKACDSANNCSAVSNTVSMLPTGKFTTAAELVSDPIATQISTRKAKILWTTERKSDSKIAYGTKSGDYFKNEIYDSTQDSEHAIELTNLQPGTTYFYQAKWTDEDGNTGIADEKSFTTSPAPSVLSAKETAIGISQASIVFTVKNASKVNLNFGKTKSYGGAILTNTSTLESTYTVKLEGLDDNSTYNYKLTLQDQDGFTYEFENHSFNTLPKPKLSNVTVQEIKGLSQPAVLITWHSNTETSSILSYYPEGRSTQNRDEVDAKMIQGEHKYIIKGLSADSTYNLSIKGLDKLGNEAVSDVIKFNTSTDTRSPKISNLRVEGFINSGNETERSAQLIVSWDTDEASTSQVEFAEGTGSSYSQNTQEDSNLTYNHLVIINNLTPSKVYHLRVITKDKSGNITKSIDTVTITPKSSQSALDLIIGNLSDIFKF